MTGQYQDRVWLPCLNVGQLPRTSSINPLHTTPGPDTSLLGFQVLRCSTTTQEVTLASFSPPTSSHRGLAAALLAHLGAELLPTVSPRPFSPCSRMPSNHIPRPPEPPPPHSAQSSQNKNLLCLVPGSAHPAHPCLQLPLLALLTRLPIGRNPWEPSLRPNRSLCSLVKTRLSHAGGSAGSHQSPALGTGGASGCTTGSDTCQAPRHPGWGWGGGLEPGDTGQRTQGSEESPPARCQPKAGVVSRAPSLGGSPAMRPE